ncbi:MAG: hypothetical protein OSA23_12530 [Rhodospirillales bacterium]|nr:hypothetical protein [Rhodospirillales bacterium]
MDTGFGGITLAHNARSKEQVDVLLIEAIGAGRLCSNRWKKFFGAAIQNTFLILMVMYGKLLRINFCLFLEIATSPYLFNLMLGHYD